MRDLGRKVSLGFTNKKFEKGVHICQIYNSEEERRKILLDFLVSGLNDDDNAACFTESETELTFSDFLEQNGISLQKEKNSQRILLHKTYDTYFEDGKFIPEKMLKLLKEFYQESKKKGFKGARVLGEMTPEVEKVPGGSRLLEYESKVSLLIRKYPVTTICQYDARKFDGSTIMDILKVHPYMIVRGAVVRNPFFIQPEEYLSQNK